MFDLNSIYKPITAQPFLSTNSYTEIPPCDQLKPFVACFWGTQELGLGNELSRVEPKLVIPDTCMDIIFTLDCCTNHFEANYVGISDSPFLAGTNNQRSISCFGIRFYFWAVHLFADESMKDSFNSFENIDAYFNGWKEHFNNILTQASSLRERIHKAEQFLHMKLNLNKCNPHVLNAVYNILKTNGSERIKDVIAYSTLSQRQLERLFLDHIGVSIKKVSSLIRYQNLWQEIVYSYNFNVNDAVEKYRYTDQSHLINEFTKYHSLTPTQAKKLALERP